MSFTEMSSDANEMSFETAISTLEWYLELGIDEAIEENPINRFQLTREETSEKYIKEPSNFVKMAQTPPLIMQEKSARDVAEMIVRDCNSLEALKNAMTLFDLCGLKKGARQLVFCDGNPQADLMIIGEAPGREEDRVGKPFIGRAGQLLDAMFASIGFSRHADQENALYITNVIPWRPPQNRDPNKDEIEMMLPFLKRHVALIKPKLIVIVGNIACQAVLGERGITKLRGKWFEAFETPVMPMFHPAALLRDPLKKRPAWQDLQSIERKLTELRNVS